jgi:hypothetical protein
MAFYIDTYNLPVLQSYDEARAKFVNTSPVRGEDQSVRRIGDRHHKDKWIKQEIIDGKEVYIAGLYSTELVFYYPSHYEITLGNYPSISTKLFVDRVSGMTIKNFNRKAYVPSGFHVESTNDKIECFINGHAIGRHERYAFEYGSKAPMQEHVQPKKYKVSRKIMAEARGTVAQFRAYVQGMHAIVNPDDVENYRYTYDNYKTKDETLLNDMQDETKHWALFQHIAKRVGFSEWRGGPNRIAVLKLNHMKGYIDTLLKRATPQALVEV